MSVHPGRLGVVLAIVGVFVVSSAGWGAALPLPRQDPSAGSTEVSGVPGPAAPRAPSDEPAVPAASLSSAGNIGSRIAANALAATKADGLKPNVAFVPRPSATPAQLAAAEQSGVVRPLYTASPAPMGLADYGLSEAPNGTVVGSILNTTRLVATVDMNATGVRATDLGLSSPDAFGIQLNAVVTNVTLFGTPGYAFWTQNVVEFLPAAGEIEFLSNVWNWSSPSGVLSPNVFYAHGANGTQVGTEYYYAVTEPTTLPVSYPFNLTLWLNSSVTDGRNNVSFTAQIAGAGVPGGSITDTFDFVEFNSIGLSGTPVVAPSNYTANGKQYNVLGLTDDFELIFGGPGGGSQSTLFAADATLGLGYWTGSGYASVPAAYSYGGETGETVTGANVAWGNAPSGAPYPGVTTYGTVTTGPSFLTGLWNASVPEGADPLTIAVTPADAISVVTPTAGWNPVFTYLQSGVAPGLFTNVFSLSPGNYSVVTELSDYAPVTHAIDLTGPLTLTFSLVPSLALGVYTPLWTASNAGIAAVATQGSGTPNSPYLIPNQQHLPFGAAFGLYNDYGYSVYPGVLFYGTTATTEFRQPASLATTTNDAAEPGPLLPGTNDLPFWFDNVTHVAIVGAENISGWFGAGMLYYPTFTNPFNVVFYGGGDNLIANNTFNTEAQALLLFRGPALPGPFGLSGGNNTVFGNRFEEVPVPPPAHTIPGVCAICLTVPYADGLALEVAESNDLVYNNYVATPSTAWVLPFNLYSGTGELFAVVFNVSSQPASTVHIAPGFPFWPLSGNILGLSTEGGNFWWDYGVVYNPYNGADNPFGVLPYDEDGLTFLDYAPFIYPGGDYLPLTLTAFYAVTVTERGLPTGLVWGAELFDAEGFLVGDSTTTAASFSVELPNGVYSLVPVSPGGWTSSSTRLAVSGRPTGLSLSFRIATGLGARELTFYRAGLPAHTAWSVTLNGTSPATDAYNATETTSGPSLVFAVGSGAYTFAASPVPGYRAPVPGSVTVGARNVGVTVAYAVYTYSVTVSQTGLPGGLPWSVTIDGRTIRSTGTTLLIGVPNGTFNFVVHAPIGWLVMPGSGEITISAASATLSVSFARR